MKKKKVLIISPVVFRDFDYFRYEIKNLEKDFEVEVIIHELTKIISPRFIKAYKNYYKSKKILRFESYFIWKKEFRRLIDQNPDLLIIKDIPNSNFFSFLINLEIKKSKKKVLEYVSSGGLAPKIGLSLKKINFFKLSFLKKIIFFLNGKIFNIFGNLFRLYPSHCLKAGSMGFKNIYNKFKVNIIDANTFDYSNYITYKKKIYKKTKEKIVIFLDSPAPLYHGDYLLTHDSNENLVKIKNWYPSLNNFFSNIENLLNAKVKISVHPKIDSPEARYKYKNIFEGREILKKRPLYYLNNTKLIVSKESTGFSFAVIKNIPLIILTSKDIINENRYIEYQKFLARELGTNIFNIDDNFDLKKFHKLMEMNKKKYDEFKKKYLTSLNTLKPNYKLIGENFL